MKSIAKNVCDHNQGTVRYSLVLPTLNEAAQLPTLLEKLSTLDETYECILVDGNSTDETSELVKAYPKIKFVKSNTAHRAKQLNLGAKQARGEYLFFLHADSRLPKNFKTRLKIAHLRGEKLACFQLKFDYGHWFLRFNTWFTRFNTAFVRYGDQGLFVSRNIFFLAGAYDESLRLLEDQQIIWRLKRLTSMHIWPETITTSSRKYLQHGIYRLQLLYAKITLGYYLGFSQKRLYKYYKKIAKDTPKPSMP